MKYLHFDDQMIYSDTYHWKLEVDVNLEEKHLLHKWNCFTNTFFFLVNFGSEKKKLFCDSGLKKISFAR